MNIKSYYSELKNSLQGGILYILSGSILSKAIIMISSIIIARILDKNEYAYYNYSNNLYQYIDLIAGLGLASAVLIKCSAAPYDSRSRSYFRFAVLWGVIFQLIMTSILSFVIYRVEIPFPEAKKYIYMLCFMPLTTFCVSLIQVYNRVLLFNRKYALLGVVQALITCLLGAVLVYYISVPGMIIARYVATVATLGLGLYFIRSFFQVPATYHLNREEISSFLKLALSLMIAHFFSSIMPINEAYLVNNVIQDEIITSNFKVAGMIPEQLILITSAVMTYFFPQIAKIKNKIDVWAKAKKIAILNGIIVAIVASMGMLISPYVLQLLYGSKYHDAIPLTYMLWIMRFSNTAIRMVPLNILTAIGQTKVIATLAVISCIVQTLLDYYFIITIGISGVAYATILVYLASGIIMWTYLRKHCYTSS